MNDAPLIGLPGRRTQAAQIAGFPASLGRLDFDIYFADYARCVLAAGGLPVHLPLDVDPRDLLDRLDGLVLTGGADVDPARYGAENTASKVDPQRDEIEFALFEGALARELPVLGICRGMQVINVHRGGTLDQHVPAHERYDVDPAARIHSASVEAGTALHELYGDTAAINSLHHQRLADLGDGVRPVAWDRDGTIEAIELEDVDVVAVQWHPEMLDGHEPVFDWIVARASERRARRERRGGGGR